MAPLADRIRPTTLKDFIGQEHLVGKNKPISLAIEKNEIHSMIFWGPPGSGKTTLARIIAQEIEAEFFHLSAVSAGKADVRKIIEEARAYQQHNKLTVLFLDEIHRFNKIQQDFLLPYVEDGTIILVGATTENPSFTVISPLLSRTHIYTLHSHSEEDLSKVVDKGIKEMKLKVSKKVKDFLITYSNGDARKALNLIEATAKLYCQTMIKNKSSAEPIPYAAKPPDAPPTAGRLYNTITMDNLKDTLQSTYLRYDKSGEEHYDTISAFIKSMRASQPNAAIYYLARMVEAGEDPLFIARRMVIFASEDIGMAQPTALVVANEVFRACEIIGYPECAINLAHGVVYLAKAKKDRSSYDALRTAQADIQQHGNRAIPLHIRNAPTKLMKDLGYGKGYNKYDEKSFLPEKLKNKKYLKGK